MMTLLEAENMTSSDGKRYGDRPDKELLFVANNAKSPAGKAQAARLILAARANPSAVPPMPDDATDGPSTPAPVVSEWETFDKPAEPTPPAPASVAQKSPAAERVREAVREVAERYKPAPKPAQAAKIEKREWPNLAAALAAAQGLIVAAEKNRENPFFKSRYATLESVWDACRDALSSNGLAVIQIPVNGEERGQVGVTTILCHASGEQVSGTIYAKAMKDDAQGYGSVITYLRRYSLAAFVGVTSEEDDDGNAATQQGKQQARR